LVLLPAATATTAARSGAWRWCGEGDVPPPADGESEDLVYAAGHGDEAIPEFIRWARSVRARHVVVVGRLGIPGSEAVLGAARAWRLERPDLHVRAVAVADGTTRARVVEELERDEPEIVLDGERRLVRAVRALETSDRPFPLPAGATAVVTGGFGGIG